MLSYNPHTILVGGWALPLWKIWVRQLGLFFPIYGKTKKCSKPRTSIFQNRALPACTNLQYFAIVFLKLSRQTIIYLLHVCWPMPICCKGKRKRGKQKKNKQKNKKSRLIKVTKIGFLGVSFFCFVVFFLFFGFLVFWFLGFLFSGSLLVFWRAGKTTQK